MKEKERKLKKEWKEGIKTGGNKK